ncbi:ATP-binding protein [Labrys wisconsinensis]|uniref:histidine kinase n=1 Tax=Labrys wisconsinensis TaxID=425677 RepID=A0ABU0JJ36_9HYPH|nr:ATP-binding protein [Labrys wisconsinensis]MDQ0474293.1 signal transduction histidine kinase [Labrys wisconsinensis]
MADAARRSPSLTRIVALRITLFAILAAAVQAAMVFADYYFRDDRLAVMMIQSETEALAAGVTGVRGRLAYSLPTGLERYGPLDSNYVARIRTASGQILYTDCDRRCDDNLLPPAVDPPELWSRRLNRGKPIAVAGGRSFTIGGEVLFVEIGIRDDTHGVTWRVLGRRFIERLAVPMSIMLACILLGTVVSVRYALRPVARAAREAEHVDPLDPGHRISQSGMPREVADLAAAVNRSLSRIGALMTSQRLFTTAVAHEIRTPLAMMKLELGAIADPGARKVEEDIDRLAGFIGQITALGRLESTDRTVFRPVDLAETARRVVADIAPWVYDQDHAIAFFDAGAAPVDGHAALLDDAVRNLVENAVRHTPAGTAVEVTAGPGAALSVSDNAGLFGAERRDEAAARPAGVGLEIVRRIMVLHKGRLVVAVAPARRTAMRLDFEADGGAAA